MHVAALIIRDNQPASLPNTADIQMRRLHVIANVIFVNLVTRTAQLYSIIISGRIISEG